MCIKVKYETLTDSAASGMLVASHCFASTSGDNFLKVSKKPSDGSVAKYFTFCE